MEQPHDTPSALGWILASIPILGAAWAIAARVFSFVTRKELEKALAQQRQDFSKALLAQMRQFSRERTEDRTERQRLHDENKGLFSELFDKSNETREELAQLKGEISGRFKAMGNDR